MSIFLQKGNQMRIKATTNRPLTLKEASNALGLSVHTLRSWISKKQIRHVRLGRSIRILPGVIEELLRNSTVEVRERELGTADRDPAWRDSQPIEEGW
jgi:excisionase family DNA binding protein